MEFKDLELEIIPDSDVSSEGTLEYRYSGNLMGSVRAVLSPSYLEKRAAKPESEAVEKDSPEKVKEKEKKVIGKDLLKDKTLLEKGILAAASVVLVILIITFVVLLVKGQRRRHK